MFLREKSGRWTPEKIIAFVGACLPALWLAWRAFNGELNPARPVNEAIHGTGYWTVLFVVFSLAVTPARRLFAAPKLINMRRTLGVTAFCYALLHLTLYVVEQKYDLAKVFERDRAAHLSHHRLRRADRPDRARRHLDRRHDPAARRRRWNRCTSSSIRSRSSASSTS